MFKTRADQPTRSRRSERAWSNCVLCIPYIISGSPNECWVHTCDACVITTWWLGLRAPFVACNKFSALKGPFRAQNAKAAGFGFSMSRNFKHVVNLMRGNKIEAMYKRKQQPIALKASKRQSGKKKICDERKHLPHTLKGCRLLQTVSA